MNACCGTFGAARDDPPCAVTGNILGAICGWARPVNPLTAGTFGTRIDGGAWRPNDAELPVLGDDMPAILATSSVNAHGRVGLDPLPW